MINKKRSFTESREEKKAMKMTESEYKDLIAHFEFLNDKVEKCYKRETDAVVKKLKEEYEKYVIKF